MKEYELSVFTCCQMCCRKSGQLMYSQVLLTDKHHKLTTENTQWREEPRETSET